MSGKITSIFHLIAEEWRLAETFLRVNRNASPGTDGVRWSVYRDSAASRIESLSARLYRGTYRLQPLREVQIPKPDGGTRTLLVPCLEDRIVSSRLARVLVECSSFGRQDLAFGPERERAIQRGIRWPNDSAWIYETDFSDCFGSIPTDRLLSILSRRIRDLRVLRLVEQFCLKDRGIAQGLPSSPVLCTLYLASTIDAKVSSIRAGAPACLAYWRYIDDALAVFSSRDHAQRFGALMAETAKLAGLALAPHKTALRPFGEAVEFLGVRYRGTRRQLARSPELWVRPDESVEAYYQFWRGVVPRRAIRQARQEYKRRISK